MTTVQGGRPPPQKQARQTGRANWPGNSSKVTTVPLCSCFCEEPAFVSLVCIPHPITSLPSESALTTSSQCSLSVPTSPSAQPESLTQNSHPPSQPGALPPTVTLLMGSPLSLEEGGSCRPQSSGRPFPPKVTDLT